MNIPASSQFCLSSLKKPLGAALVFATMMVCPVDAQGPPGKVFPTLKLTKITRGMGVGLAMGSKLTEVAKFYGLSDAEFRKLCLRNNDLRADRTGRLFFACEAMVANAPSGT